MDSSLFLIPPCYQLKENWVIITAMINLTNYVLINVSQYEWFEVKVHLKWLIYMDGDELGFRFQT